MLRKEDLELAVEFNIIDEVSKDRILHCNEGCEIDSSIEDNYITIIKELKENVILLSNELRKKDEELKVASDSLKLEHQSCNKLSQYLAEAKSDVRMLENIIDKLDSKRGKV